VPALDIEVIAPDLKDLDALVETEIPAALRREGHSRSLHALARVQRALKFLVEWQTLDVKLPSLKQRAQREEDESGEEKPSVHSCSSARRVLAKRRAPRHWPISSSAPKTR
jgi:hypothetical protein